MKGNIFVLVVRNSRQGHVRRLLQWSRQEIVDSDKRIGELTADSREFFKRKNNQ